MVIIPQLTPEDRRKELLDISNIIFDAIKRRKEELIRILSKDNPAEWLDTFLSHNWYLFLEVCRNKEMPPTRVEYMSWKLIWTGINDIYCIARLVGEWFTTFDQWVSLLLANMKYWDSKFIFQIFKEYLEKNWWLDKDIIPLIKQSTYSKKRKNFLPSCKFYDLPDVQEFIWKILQFFITDILPGLD